jgi:DNA-binding NtrC family response regulator
MDRRRRILIVDDEQGIRKLLVIAFTRAGFDVRAAASGLEAAALCNTESFDALLSDVRMPGMDGHELVRCIAERNPETCAVLMSGYDDVKCEGCGLPSEPCKLLPKPFLPKDAVEVVRQALAQTSRTPRCNLVALQAVEACNDPAHIE